MVEQARDQIDQLNPGRAYELLQRALGSADVTPAVRLRALTLTGVTELLRSNRLSARLAFEQALRLDAALRIDSLADLHSDARLVFAEARTLVAPALPQRFAVAVDLPADTIVSPGTGSLRIDYRPAARARVITTIAPAETPLALVWSDTQTVDNASRRLWDMRWRDSAFVPDGRYVLRVAASDVARGDSAHVQLYLVLERGVVDTAALPPSLDSAALLPESFRIARAPANRLLFGALLGAGAVLAPSLLGGGDLGGSKGRAIAIGGVVTAAGVIGYFKGHRDRPLPDNIRQNAETRQRGATERALVQQSNARILNAAPVRIRVEDLIR